MPVRERYPRRLGILLPSRGGPQQKPLPPRVRERVKTKTLDWFSKRFSGSTEDRLLQRPRLRGRWKLGVGVVVEDILEITIQCTDEEFKANYPHLVVLAEWVAEEARQYRVAIWADAEMQCVGT